MSLLIDTHLHIFETGELGRRWKESYDIWEYGDKSVTFSALDGDVEDAKKAVSSSGYDHAIFANVFFPRVEVDFAVDELPAGSNEAERAIATERVRSTLKDTMFARNGWASDLLAEDDRFSVFIAVDPSVVSPEENAGMISDLAQRKGIIGIKIHPVIESFFPNDPRMGPVYEKCQELGLAVLSHSGSDRERQGYGTPTSFGPVLKRFPDLKLQLAHLGGGDWRDTLQFAETFPSARFDLCEIIEWTETSDGPTMSQLAQLIRNVGVERVHLGTDFPWYDLDKTAQLVEDLPHLSRLEKTAIQGENAAEFFGLDL